MRRASATQDPAARAGRSPNGLSQRAPTPLDGEPGPGPARIAVGYVVRAKGVLGEVLVQPLTWKPARFGELERVVLERDGAPPRTLRIEGWRPDGRGALLKFAGIDTPEAAQAEVVKGYLAIPRDEVADLPEGVHYVFEVVGCRVEDEEGRCLGEVTDVLEMPTADVYAVRRPGGAEALIPAVRDLVVAVDVAARRLVVRGVAELFADPDGPQP